MPQLRQRKKIPVDVQRVLWGIAAGRCQFSGCNELLYKSRVTQERVNLAQVAHIYSFSPNGPRGHGPLKNSQSKLDEIENLFLVCHGCHQKIDQDQKGPKKYHAGLVQAWKEEHEQRVRTVTGICPTRRSHVVIYDARIGDERPRIAFNDCAHAMFPAWYPVGDAPLLLTATSRIDDSEEDFWRSHTAHLRKAFADEIRPRIENGDSHHFSIFALAPQPLLILLGSLLTEKASAVVYQPHREPSTWEWQPGPSNFGFRVTKPQNFDGIPSLAISLSGTIDHLRIAEVLPEKASIWEISIDEPHPDFLRSAEQLGLFRDTMRKVIEEITRCHPRAEVLTIFPAMPASCAVELGRIKLPKTNLTWQIYDQNNKHRKFIPALKIGSPHE